MTRLPLQLSAASGVPYYRQIVDQVADLIRAGQLGPGDRLPSVRDLAGQLVVSLITTRRAYADLENAGLIVRRQGHGTFVAEEVEMANREQTVARVRSEMEAAVGQGRRGGLGDGEIRQLFEAALTRGEAKDA